ncbi:hypothetical protein BZZ01_24890 [Nostocales cyanobacterium HT-58-2]|nr:hypothetical protein BZZ01_24890 [Nostocales cyanobacterium HT-58-2]
MTDERGSGRFCREILTSANQFFSKKLSTWNCLFAIKGSINSSNLQISFPQLIAEQVPSLNDLLSKQAGTVLSTWQSIRQNLVGIPALFAVI